MKQKLFLILAFVVILFIVIVIYFVSIKEIKSPVNEAGTATAPVSEPATNGEREVLISIDKTHYVLGEKVPATIKNNTEKTIWIPTSCGIPLTLLKSKNLSWEIHGAHPTKDCDSPPQKIEPRGKVDYILDLQSVYGHTHFIVGEGKYKLRAEYTGIDPKSWSTIMFKMGVSDSPEFVIFILGKP